MKSNKNVLFPGNATLANLTPKSLKRKFLCQKHFQPSDFKQPASRYLKQSAVPVHYEENILLPSTSSLQSTQSASSSLKVLTPTKTYASSDFFCGFPTRTYFLPGFSTLLLRQIQKKATTMSIMERVCVLSFDEMNFKENLQYSPLHDLIEGYEDL